MAGPVTVIRAEDRFRLIATLAIPAGEKILEAEGHRVPEPTRHSLQVGEHEHLEAPASTRLETLLDRFPWRFLNHSCEPNAAFTGCTLRAIHAIDPGDEITFDYDTTEYVMSSPFTCECGSDTCRGEVRGFQHLAPEIRARLLPWLAEHLRHRIDATGHELAKEERTPA